MNPSVLIVDDEKTQREGLRAALEDNYEVYLADSAAAAMELLEREHFDVMLTDLRMPQEDGMKLIARAKSLPKPPVSILMTAYGSEEIAVEAIKRGADDYLAKGKLNIDELEFRIRRAMRQQKLETENVSLRQQLSTSFGLENIIAQSGVMLEVFEIVKQVAPAQSTVLIQGESGTGKELVAKAIHHLSPRSKGPLVVVHCGGLPATLLESELFGHEKGAFTGAHERRIGRIESAQGGTLFLDEIGEIDPATQIKLLRFLGERTFERVGSNKTITADVRLVAATNKTLERMVAEGTFREDLYYRLNVVSIRMPALRERKEDIPLLAAAFLQEFRKKNNKNVTGFEPVAVDALLAYDWKGNVRELRAAIEAAVVLTRKETVGLRDLPPSVRNALNPTAPPIAGATAGAGGSMTVQEAEKQLILRALRESNGNKTEAAKKIGMSRRTLHRKLHTYHLEGF